MTVKKTSEITSEQVLVWARRAEAQRTQKALIEVTKDNKEFDTIKKVSTEEKYTQQSKIKPKRNLHEL